MITIRTHDPRGLIQEIKALIDDDQITTWTYNDNGYFTHVATQWKNKAWLLPRYSTGALEMNIIKPPKANISTVVYAYYHGHFIETVLAHLDEKFTEAVATALPATGDKL